MTDPMSPRETAIREHLPEIRAWFDAERLPFTMVDDFAVHEMTRCYSDDTYNWAKRLDDNEGWPSNDALLDILDRIHNREAALARGKV